jgi:tetratricopeptide (TPR) repeat protein
MAQLSFEALGGDPLRGEVVVFAGRLWSMARKDARALVERLGGTVDDDVSPRTTLLVVGGDSYPMGVPAPETLASDAGSGPGRIRRALALNASATGRVRIIDERTFCGETGVPDFLDQRAQIYGQKDVLQMYALLREDHLRYLQQWGFIRPVFRNDVDTWYGFTDLTTLRQVHAALQQGSSFRAVLRDLQAARSGQLAFDFRLDVHQARVVELRSRRRMAHSQDTTPQQAQRQQLEAWRRQQDGGPAPGMPDRALTTAEQYFLMGSLLDDGTPEHVEEAAQAYRRSLEHDPNLVAAVINLANIRYAHDELAEAQALYERAISLDPTYFEAYFNLGNIHHDHEQFIDAEACYREALGLNDSYADAHFYLAVTLEKMGRSVDARPHWQAYQALAPTGEWIELAKEFSE